jgi:peptide chain release factor subunit 1
LIQERHIVHIQIRLLFLVIETGIDLEEVENVLFLEWLANNYKSFGTVMEFVTNRSQEGSQFCRGFGGIGGWS